MEDFSEEFKVTLKSLTTIIKITTKYTNEL